jgi:DNA-binding GntR family transcriptional regulator
VAKRKAANGRDHSRAEIAYASLRDAIHSGRFRAGDRMREADLAEWLGISRTPIRDALKRLEGDGLVSAAPRRGLVVSQLEQQQVSELYAVRDVMEGLAGRLAAQHASPAEIGAMRDLLERQAHTRSEDFAGLARLNRLFHDVIYRATHNRYLINTLDGFESSLALLPGTTYIAPGRAATALREHGELVDAIEKRDIERAENVARTHVRAAERLRLLMISGALEAAAIPEKRASRRVPDERATGRRSSSRRAK